MEPDTQDLPAENMVEVDIADDYDCLRRRQQSKGGGTCSLRSHCSTRGMVVRKEQSPMDLDAGPEGNLSPTDLEAKMRREQTVVLSGLNITKQPSDSDFEMMAMKRASETELDLSSGQKPVSFLSVEANRGNESFDMELELNVRKEASGMELETSMRREASSMDYETNMRKEASTVECGFSSSVLNIKKEPEFETDMFRNALGTEASVMRCETMLETDREAMKCSTSTESGFRKEDSYMDTTLSHQKAVFSSPMNVSTGNAPCLMESEVKVKTEPGMHGEHSHNTGVQPMFLSKTAVKIKSEPPGEYDIDTPFESKLRVKLKRKKKVSPQIPKKDKRMKLKTKAGSRKSERISESDCGVVVKCEPLSVESSYTDFVCGKASRLKDGSTKANETVLHPKKKKKIPEGRARIMCPHCELHFCSRSSLKRHYRRKHTTENVSQIPFTCKDCGETFPRLIQLRAHERKHRGGEKTFPCQECETIFTRACHLRVHMRKHTGERPCSCEECGATFRSMSNLNRHKAKHSGLRPFICTVCNADFYQSSHLVSHIRKHTGERPFACSECEATFTQLTHLHRHMAKHTGKKPYPCSQCDQAYVEKCSLRKHMQKHAPKAVKKVNRAGVRGRRKKKIAEAQNSPQLVTQMSCS